MSELTGRRGHGGTLRRKIELASGLCARASNSFWGHEQLGEMIPDFLFLTHSVMRTSIPLMEAALERSRALQGSDPVAQELAAYLEKHIPEEAGEAEWVLEDLEVLGRTRGEALDRLPSWAVAALTGSQYYWIHHVHPVGFLGYMMVLEGVYPPDRSVVESAIARTGLPREAFRTYLEHADRDIAHSEELEETIDRLPLTELHVALIGVSAIATLHLMTQCLESVVEVHTRGHVAN